MAMSHRITFIIFIHVEVPKSWGVPLIFIHLKNIRFSLRNQPAIGDPHFWKTPMALWWTSVTWPRSWGYNGGRNLPVCSWRFWHLGIWGIYRNLWFFSRKSLEIPWSFPHLLGFLRRPAIRPVNSPSGVHRLWWFEMLANVVPTEAWLANCLIHFSGDFDEFLRVVSDVN